MSGIYTVSRTVTALSTSSDTMTIVAAVAKPLRIHIIDISGQGAAAADNTVLITRSTGGTTPASAIVPQPTDPTMPASGFAVYTAWSSQPTLSSVPLWRASINALNGKDRFVASPGTELFIPAAGQVSIRSFSGTSNVVINLLIEEIG